LLRKCFPNKSIFVLKKFYFRFGNTSTFVSETLRKTHRKNRISFVVMAHACHPRLRASVSTAYHYNRIVSKTLPQRARHSFGGYQNWNN